MAAAAIAHATVEKRGAQAAQVMLRGVLGLAKRLRSLDGGSAQHPRVGPTGVVHGDQPRLQRLRATGDLNSLGKALAAKNMDRCTQRKEAWCSRAVNRSHTSGLTSRGGRSPRSMPTICSAAINATLWRPSCETPAV